MIIRAIIVFLTPVILSSQNIIHCGELKCNGTLTQELGVPIHQCEFDSLVNKFIHIMQKGDSIKGVDQYVILARLFNTISYSSLSDIDKYKKLLFFYGGRYFNATIKNLEAKPAKGLYFRSKRYNITIGGPDSDNSRYRIIGY